MSGSGGILQVSLSHYIMIGPATAFAERRPVQVDRQRSKGSVRKQPRPSVSDICHRGVL